MVLKIPIELSKFKGNDGRKGSKSRPYNNHEMGTSIFTGNRKERVPLQKIWLFYKTSEKHHNWDIYMP
jgi:hypothetical protein